MQKLPPDESETITRAAALLKQRQRDHRIDRAAVVREPRAPRVVSDRRRGLERASLRRRHQRKRAKFDSLKRGPCADCGATFHPFVMDFDHREGTKKLFGIALAVNMNLAWARVLAEVAKCDLVCANCHRMRTLVRLDARRLPVPPSPIDPMRCKRGHLRTPQNTRWKLRGGGQVRECGDCERARYAAQCAAVGKPYNPRGYYRRP